VVLLLPCCWLGSLSLQDFLSRRKEKKKNLPCFSPLPPSAASFPQPFSDSDHDGGGDGGCAAERLVVLVEEA
jgi:hypothetical protein